MTDLTQLKSTILRLVQKRGPNKTICPSETAREATDNQEWRDLMEPVRQAARELHKEGRIRIEQQGEPVDPDDFSGPIRLRLNNSDDE